MDGELEGYMTITEAAEKYGYNARTLRHAIQTKSIPGRLVGKTWLIREADVLAHRDRTGHSPGRPRRQPPEAP